MVKIYSVHADGSADNFFFRREVCLCKIEIVPAKRGFFMKNNRFIFFLFLFLFAMLPGCSESTSPAESVTTASLVTRSWKGESFILLTTGQTARIVKDAVIIFEFKKEGTCVLSQASWSISSVSGQWKLDNDDKNVVLTLNRPMGTVTEILPIKELNTTHFILGDTTVYGYSLVPQ
jgi:hypothetical protein